MTYPPDERNELSRKLYFESKSIKEDMEAVFGSREDQHERLDKIASVHRNNGFLATEIEQVYNKRGATMQLRMAKRALEDAKATYDDALKRYDEMHKDDE